MSTRSVDELLGPPLADEGSPRPSDAAPSRASRGDHALVGGAYEGASRTNQELALWSPPLRSGDADILWERDAATARARDVTRNDAYIQSGTALHKDGIVGSMFVLNCKPNTVALGIDDEEWETEFQEEVENKFMLWAESPDNWVDASRMNTLTGLVRLAVGVYLYGGEVLATAEYIKDRDRLRPFNTAIQMIECDRLCNPIGGDPLKNIVGGVEKNEFGAAQAYYIRKAHPSDVNRYRPEQAHEWKRIPARLWFGRQQVIHILEQQRPDQTRGMSELVTALKEMRVTKKFRDIVLQNAVVNATFAASIESDLPKMEAFETLGGGDTNALVEFAEEYLTSVSDYARHSSNLAIGGVRIPHLFPGTKLQLRPAGQGGPLGTEFEASLLRYIAANLGVSYEQLSRDYSQTNYSAVRAAMTETWKFMLSRKKMVADRFATAVFRLWFEEAVNKGMIETMKGRPDFYDPMMKDAYTQCEWIGASRGQIDELKETQAAALRISKGLSTFEIEHSRLGQDWRKMFKQQAREQKMREDLDLLPIEEDPNMLNAASGSPREQGDGEPKEKSDE